MKRLYFSIILGIAPVFGLSPVLGAQETSAEHNHADGTPCTADHGHDEHQHKEGETCTEGHDHKEHTHPDGTVCTGDHDHEGHQHAEGKACTDDHDHDKPSAGGAGALEDMIPLHVDEKARHSLDMRFEKVTAVPHGAERTLHGQMVIPPHAVNTYALPAAGRVTFHVKSAQQVRKGQLLYTLASPDIVEMEGAAAQAKAELNRCIADLAALKERRQTLEKIGTKNSELNTTIRFKETEEESLKAALNASENKLKLATASGELKDNLLYVYAAADGSVQSVDMTQGAWGEQGAPALVMTNRGIWNLPPPFTGRTPSITPRPSLR